MNGHWQARAQRVRHALADHFERVGWGGTLGIVLVIGAVAAQFALLRPEARRVDALKAELARMSARPAVRPAAAPSPRSRMADFYGLFPPASRPSGVLDKVVAAAAAQGLTLEQGEYRFARDPGADLLQFQINLPVKGSYAQVRKFLAAALAAVPALALDGVEMEREKIGDSVLAVKIHLVAYMREEP